ncbi:MAG TPA: VOC family protein [Acidimicrobiales bacterium]|jgi:4a-hydroxytetrahydrobiopterin dehydratase|nr:VOC family protein [Acidimicrobiales bacterium]
MTDTAGDSTPARADRPPVIVDVGLDVNDLPTMRAFWEATLGYHEVRGKDSYSYLVDPSGRGPHLFLQVVPEPRTEKNRLHLDIVVPSLPHAVEAAEARGAVRVTEFKTPITWFVVLEDPEGNQFCLVDEPYWEQTRPPYWEVRTDAGQGH